MLFQKSYMRNTYVCGGEYLTCVCLKESRCVLIEDAHFWKQYMIIYLYFLANQSVQSLSRDQLFATPWTAACQASLSIANFQSLIKLMFIESVMPSNHLILCHLLLLPSIFPSIRAFSNEPVLCIKWPKYIFCLINWFLLYPY